MARTRGVNAFIFVAVAVASLLVTAAAPARASGSTSPASVSSGGAASNGYSAYPSTSGDGLLVAFTSAASNLSARDQHDNFDVFVRDRRAGRTIFASPSRLGGTSNGHSIESSLADDGSAVAFSSDASDLVSGDFNGVSDVFVRDLVAVRTERVPDASSEPNGPSGWPSVSGDGRYVAYESAASNLVPHDGNGATDVFIYDRLTKATERISVTSSGGEADGWSIRPAISPDARYVAFTSIAPDLVEGDTNGEADVFLRDRLHGTTEIISVSSSETPAVGGWSIDADVSDGGRFVAFTSEAANLAPGDSGSRTDVFVRDRVLGTTTLASRTTRGSSGNGYSGHPSISADGSAVAFDSTASDLVVADVNGRSDVFVYDAASASIALVSRGAGDLPGTDHSLAPSLSGDGTSVAFASDAATLVVPDLNAARDVFVRDLA
ncbi:MAG TPA: hypothetical protein VM600_01460 [Actinomycetota bacterium]|nr:hypothetical protein [Actinomycetota bacterium]